MKISDNGVVVMKKTLMLALAVLLLFGGCSAQNAAVSSGFAGYRASLVKQNVEPLDAGFVGAINGFGLDAAKQLYSEDENLALSPASIEIALCMTKAGAAGETAKEMADVLGLTGLSDREIRMRADR